MFFYNIVYIEKPTAGASFPWMLHELHVASFPWNVDLWWSKCRRNQQNPGVRKMSTQHIYQKKLIGNCNLGFDVHPFLWETNQFRERGTIWLLLDRVETTT